MPLSSYDLMVLRLAARDAEGRLRYVLLEDGSLALSAQDLPEPLLAPEAFPRLLDLGLLMREVRQSFVLTPRGWDAVAQGRPSL